MYYKRTTFIGSTPRTNVHWHCPMVKWQQTEWSYFLSSCCRMCCTAVVAGIRLSVEGRAHAAQVVEFLAVDCALVVDLRTGHMS